VAAAAAELEDWKAVLNEFPGVIQPLSGASQPAHGVEHQIVTAGPPTAAKFRRLDNTKLAAVRPASGPALSTWSGKRTAVGGPAATIAAST
jgi:hypothetical protein